MFYSILSIGVLLVFGTLGLGDDICVPNPVQNLTLTEKGVLTWAQPDNCDIKYYFVRIVGDDNIYYHYEVSPNNLDVSSLPLCEHYNFSVTAVSETNVQGKDASIAAKILPGTPENLTVSHFSVSTSNRNMIELEWQMEDGVQRCVTLFRVVVWDDDGNTPHDVYVDESRFNFTGAIPCMKYEFGIRPVYDSQENTPLTVFNYTYPGSPTTAPVLTDIVQGVTSVNMTWDLETYQENRCQITAMIIDASPSFNLSHPIEDSTLRRPVAFEILNLQPNTAYISRVSVLNTAGLSEAVTVPLQTLENSTALELGPYHDWTAYLRS